MEKIESFKIDSNLDSLTLFSGGPFTFNIGKKREISFTVPTVRETAEFDFKYFLGIIAMKKEDAEKMNLKIPIYTYGAVTQHFITFLEDYREILFKYFKRYIINCQIKESGIYVDDEKITSDEFDFIVKTILISLGQLSLDSVKKEYEDKEKEKPKSEVELTPAQKKIEDMLKKQKESEEKLKRAKEKKAQNASDKTTAEDIIIAVTKVFGFSHNEVLNMNYYTLFKYFAYVGSIDSNEIEKMAVAFGSLKSKNYKH
jgi:exonuclease VII small subunit